MGRLFLLITSSATEMKSRAIKKVAMIGLGTLGLQTSISAVTYAGEVRGHEPKAEIFPKTIQKLKSNDEVPGQRFYQAG